MHNVYARELCVLLRELDIKHDSIAERLHVAPSSVAGWAGGKRPVPKRHIQAFGALVRETIEHAYMRAMAHPHDGRTLLASAPAIQVTNLLFTHLRRWELELYDSTGQLEQEYAAYTEILKQYLHIPIHKLSREERDQVRKAGNGLVRTLRAMTYVQDRIDALDGRMLGWPNDPTPLAYFDRLWAFAMTQSDDAEGEKDEDAIEAQ